MSTTLHITASPGEARIAVTGVVDASGRVRRDHGAAGGSDPEAAAVDGGEAAQTTASHSDAGLHMTGEPTLLDFMLWRPGAPDGVGDLHRGRVSALAPAMGGAFVDLAGSPGGFLSDRDGAAGLREGQAVHVRITRAALGGKGPRLRAVADSPASGAPALLERGPTPLDLLAARWDGPILVDDAGFAALIPAALRHRVQRVPRAFSQDVEADVVALSDSEVELPGGMSATITPTPALVAIDMDGGATTGVAQMKQTAQFAANRAALPVLMRQIRLRNLSGAILIDPAGLATRKRQALLEPVAAALAEDPLKPRCLGVTALGLVEIVRARVHPPLHELLASPHGRALAALREVVAACNGQPGARPVLRAGIGLVRALEGDPDAVAAVAQHSGRILTLRADPALPSLAWSIENG